MALSAIFFVLQPGDSDSRLLLAPMMGVMEDCILAARPPMAGFARNRPMQPLHDCVRDNGSAATLIESTLSGLGPRVSRDGRFELGYTLQIPLMQLFRRSAGTASAAPTTERVHTTGSPGWSIDREAVRRTVRTLQDNPRPAIVYLFSTHFGTGAPIEAELARDPANLAATPNGAMAQDRYYTLDIHPWSVARTDNPITHRRAEAIDAVVDQLCRLPRADRAKIRGITLLGEAHHLFPDFESGMGFSPPYLVSDYSAASVRGFRGFLRQRFGHIGALNAWLARDRFGPYGSFDQVDPPSKDIRTQPLDRFEEHIDSFAHGTLPISGWVAPTPNGASRWIRIYLNGELLTRVPSQLSRQDVLAAQPTLGTADVGWRWDLNFSRLRAGVHRIDLLLEPSEPAMAPELKHMGTRHISVMARNQQTPPPVPMRALPRTKPATAGAAFFIDQPGDQSAYWFNPLVQLWHEFRNYQVVRYLDWFDRRVGRSCLWDTPRYLHQIVPGSNPGWDANKFAVDASLQPVGGIRLGVSLYGEPTYGSSFFDRLTATGVDRYGVTEFHPLKSMATAPTGAMLERHRQHGASFVSFFLEPRAHGERLSAQMNIFSFDPANPKFGSELLYRSVRALMDGQAGTKD